MLSGPDRVAGMPTDVTTTKSDWSPSMTTSRRKTPVAGKVPLSEDRTREVVKSYVVSVAGDDNLTDSDIDDFLTELEEWYDKRE
jgi:hypothetical protein